MDSDNETSESLYIIIMHNIFKCATTYVPTVPDGRLKFKLWIYEVVKDMLAKHLQILELNNNKQTNQTVKTPNQFLKPNVYYIGFS